MRTEPVFALDIGTRSVVGILALPAEGGRMTVLDAEAMEHGDRAMRDGQVHDVPEVGRRIAIVAERLAARSRIRLDRAFVAAAGRALQTAEVAVSLPVPPPGEVTERLTRDLAIAGVAEAIGSLPDRASRPSQSFHCVGFSVVRHVLDGAEIANPLGQRGDLVEARIIATFLPRVVTDGLALALRQAGLEIAGITLEPIAAVNVAIPPTMRQLNLALVDIGAGTSDIALTRKGAVTGYAMVPMAGDAMTEVLAQAHLLDFPEAERLKIAYGAEPPGPPGYLDAVDILGTPVRVGPAELATLLQPAAADLSARIAREILTLNGSAPAAVVCIGGGSLTPRLAPAIAGALGLPATRVGVRGAEMVKAADLSQLAERAEIHGLLCGPAGVTPLGIAWGAIYRPGFRFRDVWVRATSSEPAERRVQILDLGRATVFDALLAAGLAARTLTGRPGLGLAVRVDGELRLIPGAAGKAAAVTVDGQPAALDTMLAEGAHIEYDPAIRGSDAQACVGDVVDASPLAFTLNGRLVSVPARVTIDGRPAAPDAQLKDGAEIGRDRSLRAALSDAGFPLEREVVRYRLNGVEQEIPRRSYTLRVNGVLATPDFPLEGGEHVTVECFEHPYPRVGDVVPDGAVRVIGLYLNGHKLEVPVRGFSVLRGESEVPLDEPVCDGDALEIEFSGLPIVADILALSQSELVRASGPGKQLELKVNGAPGQFTTALDEGSRIEARWIPTFQEPA